LDYDLCCNVQAEEVISMRMIRLSVLLLAALPVIPQEKNSLPPDIDPVTLSRLPPVTPADLDEAGQGAG